MPAGSIFTYHLFEVAEQLDLESIRASRPATAGRAGGFRHPMPSYAGFERPPAIESVGVIDLPGGPFSVRIRFFDFGVVSVEHEVAFESDWNTLVGLAATYQERSDLSESARKLARERITQLDAGTRNAYAPETWLMEDYVVVLLRERGGQLPPDQVAQIVRGETLPLSEDECRDVMASRVSYYSDDVLVIGWAAALVYDPTEDVWGTLQILEHANTQLLEYRYYDDVLDRLLTQLYSVLERRRHWLARWRMAKEAAQLNQLRLEVMELAERSDNSLRFFGDMYYARAYRLANERIGVADYRASVDEKIRAAGQLYQFLIDEFHHSRAFLLEAMVVAILIIDLVYLVRGKS